MLSQSKTHGAASAGSHKTVDAVVADAWVDAAPICRKVYLAEKGVSEANVGTADNSIDRKKRGVNIRRFDRLQYAIDSVTSTLEQVTEVPNPLQAVNSTH